jgi:DNA polymerase elongation subunit (family B)
MKEKKAPSQVRVNEHRLDAVDANGCPTIVRVHGHERSFYVRAPDAVAALVLKDAFPQEMKAQADNKTNDARDAKNMPLATSTTRLALPPIDTPAELMPIKDHHKGKIPGWHWKELKEHKAVCKAADAEAKQLGKEKADVYPPTARSMRLDAEAALEARRQAHLTMKKETWQAVRKARDHKLANNGRANRWGAALRETLEQQLQLDKSLEWPSGSFCYHIVSGVTPVLRQSIHGYDFDEQSLYYRITMSLPRVQNKLVKFLQTSGVTIDGTRHVFADKDMGNAELDGDLQFLVENGLAGQSWITLPANTYKITTGPVPAEMLGRVGEAGYEFEADKQSSSRSGSNKSSDDAMKDTEDDLSLLNRLGPDGGAMEEPADGAPSKKRVRTVVGYEEEQPGEAAAGLNARKTWYRAEIDINYKSLVSHYREKGKWERIVPLRTISFDLECASLKKGRFPVANPKDQFGYVDDQEKGDPVISISAVLQEGANGRRRKTVLTYKLPADKFNKAVHVEDPNDLDLLEQDCDVWVYRDERDMLVGFAELMRSCQPSVLTGYNILGFDMPYLLDRATKLGIDNFAFLSPVKEITSMKASTYQSKAMGVQNRLDAEMAGVLVFDLCRWMVTNEKLSSYTLNAVAAKFIGKTKDDLHHSLITQLFYGTRAQRKRLLKYNLVDSALVLDLIAKKKITFGLAEIARVCGVTNHVLNTKGQGIKTESQLQRLMLQHGFVAPILPHKNKKEITTMEEMIEQEEVQYTGAICIEPKMKLYKKPIATQDFASLYPSVMLAYNLDYATYLLDPENDLKRLHPDDYVKIECSRATPEDPDAKVTYYFVKRHVRQGQCPLLLANLLGERGQVKKQMKKHEEHSDEYGILDSRSTALKLSANSTYGFCAGFVLHLPSISESVCAMGRKALEQTIALVEGHFTKANGYPDDAKVIYGDTDSVMVLYGVESVKEASDLAFETQSLINESFADLYPMSVEFEKVYKPYLLCIKKHYAGLKYAPGTEESEYHFEPAHPAAIKGKCNYAPNVEGAYLPSLDFKGLEPKRRDKIPFVKRVMTQALDYIFWERDVQKALDYCQAEITKLIQGEIDLSEIIKSKSLKLGQVGESPQASVAAKKAKRDPATAPGNGSRVSWVPLLIPGKGKNEAKKFETAEDPMYALKNHLPIDYKDVAESDVYNALHRLFKYCFYDDDKPDAENVAHSEACMKPMFDPIETARFIDDRPLGGPMARFAQVVDTCKRCGVIIRLDQEEAEAAAAAPGGPQMPRRNDFMADARPDDPTFIGHAGGEHEIATVADRLANEAAGGLPNAPGGPRRPGTRVVCARCVNHLPILREQNAAKIKVLEQTSKAIWDKCAACSEAPLDCSNDDCKIFYKREAVNEQLSEALARKVKIDF